MGEGLNLACVSVDSGFYYAFSVACGQHGGNILLFCLCLIEVFQLFNHGL